MQHRAEKLLIEKRQNIEITSNYAEFKRLTAVVKNISFYAYTNLYLEEN